MRETNKLFIPHKLKTIEVDAERKIFRVNGEYFGKNCTGFRITCYTYRDFDIRLEIDTTVHFVRIRNGQCIADEAYETDVPQFSPANINRGN